MHRPQACEHGLHGSSQKQHVPYCCSSVGVSHGCDGCGQGLVVSLKRISLVDWSHPHSVVAGAVGGISVVEARSDDVLIVSPGVSALTMPVIKEVRFSFRLARIVTFRCRR